MTQPTLLEMAEEIERLTEGRIPLDRASWIALYIQRLEGGMTHEQAIAAEEQEHAERGQPSPYQPAAPQEGHQTAEAEGEERTRIGNTPTTTEDELLEAAAEAQTAYWNALHDLEEATGLDIDSTQDLAGKTVADLTEN